MPQRFRRETQIVTNAWLGHIVGAIVVAHNESDIKDTSACEMRFGTLKAFRPLQVFLISIRITRFAMREILNASHMPTATILATLERPGTLTILRGCADACRTIDKPAEMDVKFMVITRFQHTIKAIAEGGL
jgi:hypothetical protein